MRFVLFFFCFTQFLCAQELPPVRNFEPSFYNAGNQNWMISQSDQGYIYVANNKGLLEYNGAQWRLYPTPNESIMRSVNSHNGRIYTGCYMDFGYWQPDNKGFLHYQSLVDETQISLSEDEQFWNIITRDDYVLFQSFSHIYSYDINTGKVNELIAHENINKFFEVSDSFYYQVIGKGLFEIVNGSSSLYSDASFFKKNMIIYMFDYAGGSYFITDRAIIYKLEDNSFTEVAQLSTDESITVYTALLLSDDSLLIGTISNGVYKTNMDGQISLHIDQENGLINNTSLSAFEDDDKNLWLGLDNGVSCVNMDSPYRIYTDKGGDLGTVYTTLYDDTYLYLGTNQGLFCKKNEEANFQFIPGTEGQVWSLKMIDGQILCGHHSGVFVINKDKAVLIDGTPSAWDIIKISQDSDNLLIGAYDGLYLLSNMNKKYQLDRKVSGFNISSKSIVVDDHTVYVNHEYKGVFELSLNNEFSEVNKVNKLESLGKGIGSDLIKYHDQVIFAKKDGFYIKSSGQETFSKEESLSGIFDFDDYTSGKMIKTDDGYLWVFTANYLNKISLENIDSSYSFDQIPLSKEMRNEKTGYENITFLGNHNYLVGSSYGYTIIDNQHATDNPQNVKIGEVSSILDGKKKYYSLDTIVSLPYENNNLLIKFNLPSYESLNTILYKYRVKGISDEWSSWSDEDHVQLKNLQHGDYVFEVKSINNAIESDNVAQVGFGIHKPFYLTTTAIVMYIVSFILLLIALNTFYIWYFKRQKSLALKQQQKELELKNLESEKNLIQLRNDKLRSDIEHRNKELAISTMAMIKKNETLNEIKSELDKLSGSKEVNSLKKLLDKNLKSKQDWITFEEAFNNADKDFFKKIKELHPNLTSGDLRLCVYLRMNLSSKEIAPLLNISPRSVEIKRYRLRKKLDLTRDDGLTSYILDI